jgi:ATP-dependent protease HslVU (ClpYQ) peptidase subunit
MTCIAALIQDKTITMGADSAASSGTSLTIRAESKLCINNGFLLGFSGSVRMKQLLKYSFIPPTYNNDEDTLKFMATDFIDAVRSCLKAGGLASKDKETENADGDFLVGFQAKLFTIYSDYQVSEALDPWACIGCGEDIANGALFATKNTKMTSQERILLALQAAERHSTAVRAPFNFLSI